MCQPFARVLVRQGVGSLHEYTPQTSRYTLGIRGLPRNLPVTPSRMNLSRPRAYYS